MKKSVAILIDQATRDAFGQLLLAQYLEKKGVTVHLCNQGTLFATVERHQPEVLFSTLSTNPELRDYLRGIRHRVRLFLVDQEGGRMGKPSFYRSMRGQGEAKLRMAESAERLVAWGESQASWMADLGIPRSKIEVTACPRLDPYMVPPPPRPQRYVGVTLRADPITSVPEGIMEVVYRSNFVQGGLAPSLPPWAKQEDWFWRILAETRHFFLAINEVAKVSKARFVVRPGPWEFLQMYDFLPKLEPRAEVNPFQTQHEYVSGAFAILDASSALGIEAILSGTPVISIVSLIPRLEEHVGGPEGARLNSPYRGFFHQPKSMEELVQLVLKAEKGELPAVIDQAGMDAYMKECYGWPAERPASFSTGDAILKMLDIPPDQRMEPFEGERGDFSDLKKTLYRWIPGSQFYPAARLFWRLLTAPDRRMLRRYHYFSVFFPHHAEVERVFQALWARFER